MKNSILNVFCEFPFFVVVDVTGRFFCGCGAAAGGSVSSSRCDSVCTVVSHSVPSGAECPGETPESCCCQKSALCPRKQVCMISFFTLRPLVQTVTIHKIRRTVESQPKRPEKSWQDGPHTGKEYYRQKRNTKTVLWDHLIQLTLVTSSHVVEKFLMNFHLRKWHTLRERITAQLPQEWQVLQSPQPQSTRPAVASTVRTSRFYCACVIQNRSQSGVIWHLFSKSLYF